MPSSVRIALVAVTLVFTACDVGVIGPAADDSPEVPVDAAVDAAPDYSLRITPSGSGALGTSITLTVDATSMAFTGPVALRASGAPASWTVALAPPSIDLVEGGMASATVEITIPTSGDGAPAGQAVTITGLALPGERAATSTVTVENTYTMGLGTPGAQGQHFGSMAGGQLRMKRGARLKIANTDTIAHRIHSDAGVQGFPHQATSMGAGAAYEVTLSSTGSDLFYCHDHGQGRGEVRLTVE